MGCAYAQRIPFFIETLWLVKVEHPARKGMKSIDSWAMIVPSVATVSWSIFYRRRCGMANDWLVGNASSDNDLCVLEQTAILDFMWIGALYAISADASLSAIGNIGCKTYM